MSHRSQMLHRVLSLGLVGSFVIGLLGLLGLTGLVTACGDLEGELEGEPCTVAKDCWHTQECSRTAQEEALALPGVCQPRGTDCVEGAQLGCGCNPADPAISYCASTVALVPPATYPAMVCDPTLLVCVVAPPEGNP